MNKEEQKKQAQLLYENGYTFGEIAKKLGVPKSTVYRWVIQNETAETADETDYGTDIGTDWNEVKHNSDEITTEMEQSLQKDEAIFDNSETFGTDSMNVEMEKIRLEHEYRMAYLEFEKKQYEDQKKLDEKAKREARLHSIFTKMNYVMSRTKQEMDAVFNAKLNPVAENIEKKDAELKFELPSAIQLKAKEIFTKYLSFDQKETDAESIIKLLDQAENVRKRIIRFTGYKKTQLNSFELWSLINQLIADLKNCISDFEDDEVLLIEIDEDWKDEVKAWILQ
jgi:transposase-like protein